MTDDIHCKMYTVTRLQKFTEICFMFVLDANVFYEKKTSFLCQNLCMMSLRKIIIFNSN